MHGYCRYQWYACTCFRQASHASTPSKPFLGEPGTVCRLHSRSDQSTLHCGQVRWFLSAVSFKGFCSSICSTCCTWCFTRCAWYCCVQEAKRDLPRGWHLVGAMGCDFTHDFPPLLPAGPIKTFLDDAAGMQLHCNLHVVREQSQCVDEHQICCGYSIGPHIKRVAGMCVCVQETRHGIPSNQSTCLTDCRYQIPSSSY